MTSKEHTAVDDVVFKDMVSDGEDNDKEVGEPQHCRGQVLKSQRGDEEVGKSRDDKAVTVEEEKDEDNAGDNYGKQKKMRKLGKEQRNKEKMEKKDCHGLQQRRKSV
ncbi:hypothetical protein MRX96_011940 [Rhipicephalus microplus]